MVGLRNGFFYFSVIACALLLYSGGTASAQQVFGRIFGTVTDASGGAVQNAKVTLTDQSKGTQFSATTNESGNFEKGQLIPGSYSVDVEATGFQKASFKNILVQVDNAARVDATLQPGNVSQTVEVTAAAPTLQSDRADVSTTFTSQQLVDLPLLGRNAQALELLMPGTSKIGWNHAASENPQGSVQIQVNGQHFSGTGFQLDGTENQDPILGIIVVNPNIDSLNEQKISSQDYDAEFGYAGAGIQNASTRSGTNQVHFSAFEYLRNNTPGFTTFARDPFAEPNGAPAFKWNQFGGSIGGKIIKDKLFFFGDAELIRQRYVSSTTQVVPTALARTGNFSEYLAASPNNAIYDPATGDQTTGVGRLPFAGNIIPTGRLSPQALAILQNFPLPNLAVSDPLLPNYAAEGGIKFDANKWDTREDYFVNEKNSLFGRYSYQQFVVNAPGAFGLLQGGKALSGTNFAGNSNVRNQSVAFGYTHTFSPTVINEFRFGYMRYNVQVTQNGVGTHPAADAGIPNLNVDDFYTSGLPYFQFNNTNNNPITSLGYGLGNDTHCNCPLTEQEQQYQFTDNLSKVAGNHTFKVGADIRYALNLRVPSDSHRAGELTFDTQNTGFISAPGAGAQNGLAFATFLLGDVTHFARYVSTTTNAAERQRRWFFYGQDSWRATPKLTINIGLRWELIFPERVNEPGNGAALDLRTGLINVFGTGLVGPTGYQTMNWANLAPRLGIAYQMNQKTVIRTGYGWAYEMGTFGATFGHNVTQNPPVLSPQVINAPTSFGDVFTLAQGPSNPTFTPVPPNGKFILPDGIAAKARPLDVRLPRVMAYNITVERQLAAQTSISVGYVGNAGRHVGWGSGDGFDQNVNAPAFVPGVSDQNTLRPFYNAIGANGQPLHWTQDIALYCMCATNYYNSLQVQVKRTYAAGLGIQASYTWQDSVVDNSDAYTFNYDRPLGRGRANWIPDHQLIVALNYNLPFGRGRKYGANMNRFVDYALGGWNISGSTTFYTGLPFTPTIGDPGSAVRPNTGPGSRPDKGSGSPYASHQSRDQWLNVGPGGTLSSAFVIPADNTFGNYGFNTLRGPIFINQDVSLAKSFRITERLAWQIRGEAYNLFNHTNLALPNSNVNGSTPGVITGISPNSTMRRLQFAARLDF
jgi:Carboxypeptidase regulatory-like domain/TonB dependent receptor